MYIFVEKFKNGCFFMEIPRISLIVSTYNRPDALFLCLESIRRQKVLPDEVIVGDDGSTDETKELIERLQKDFPVPLHHVWQEDEGFRLAMSRNKCIAKAKFEYIIQIDGDMILHSCFVSDHIRMARRGYYIRGGRVYITKKKTDSLCKRRKYTPLNFFTCGLTHRENSIHWPGMARFLSTRRKTRAGLGANMSFWRDDLLAINGYDEFYVGWGCEDDDLAERLLFSGKKKLSLKFAGIAFHLWHEEKYMQNRKKNFNYYCERVAEKATWCEKGANQYLIRVIKKFFHNLELCFRLLKYLPCFRKKQKALGFIPDIKSTDETLDKILREHCSVSRYGDGELNLMRERGNGFCRYNSSLAKRLQEILAESPPPSYLQQQHIQHITCIPRALVSQENLDLRTKVFWRAYFVNAYEIFARNLKPEKVYYDASFTRFYLAYKDKSVCKGYLEKIKRIWQDQDVLLIEGEYSRLGVNNDLFDGVRSLQRILCPAKDAYEKYDDIMDMAVRHGDKKLILIALGQTATVLSYDLAKLGYWAIDIGHVDIEYEWYLRGAKDKIQIEGKYVNEAKNNTSYREQICNDSYESTIIERISSS